MNTTRALRTRSSCFARLGTAALVGAVLAGAPIARAHAGQEGPALAAEGSPASLVEQAHAARREASERLQRLALEALERTAARMHDARLRMELVVTLGRGFASFADPEAWADADGDEPAAAPAPKGRARRLEVSTDTDDLLAGL